MNDTQTLRRGTSLPADTDGESGRVVGADRVLAVLKELSRYPDGVGLDELARSIGSPKSTVHRALQSLRRAGYADQDAWGRYVLGDELVRIAYSFHEERPESVRLQPALQRLAARFGETAHYAVLDGHEVIYRAKVDPPSGAVRLTSTIGGRNPAHATGVGKMLLALRLRNRDDVAAWAGSGRLQPRTPTTLTSVDELSADLEQIRTRGFATDDQENETGINCVAVPVYATSSRIPSGAVSVSALAYRTPLARLVDSVPEIRAALGQLGHAQR